ncbi:MAG: hypothetical protein IJO33_02110 [Bacilli bacterium]|nr:hypothetical protein [Bacilli bacterium]
MSKENFKLFAKSHPELLDYIKSGEMTWQKFYEIYDIYGEEERAWKDYLKGNNNQGFNVIKDIIKSIDTESIQKHIDSAQKAIGVVQELTSKTASGETGGNLFKGPTSPRPLNKFFED